MRLQDVQPASVNADSPASQVRRARTCLLLRKYTFTADSGVLLILKAMPRPSMPHQCWPAGIVKAHYQHHIVEQDIKL